MRAPVRASFLFSLDGLNGLLFQSSVPFQPMGTERCSLSANEHRAVFPFSQWIGLGDISIAVFQFYVIFLVQLFPSHWCQTERNVVSTLKTYDKRFFPHGSFWPIIFLGQFFLRIIREYWKMNMEQAYCWVQTAFRYIPLLVPGNPTQKTHTILC